MMFFVACVPLFAVACALRRRFDRSFAETFPVAVLAVVPPVYLGGLMGSLKIGVVAVCVLGALALVYCLADVLRKRETPLAGRFCISVPCAAALAGAVGIFVFTVGRVMYSMDSFYHWGYIVKHMHLTDRLSSALGQAADVAAYPPGQALLQYYFARFSAAFSQSALFRARNLLALSLLLPFLKNLTWRDIPRVLIIAGIALLLPFLEFADFDQMILVDGLMGLLAGFLLVTYFGNRKLDAFTAATLCLGAFVLSLIKSSCIVLCVIVSGVLLMDGCIQARADGLSKKERLRMRFLPAACVLAGALIAVLSWSVYLKAASATSLTGSVSLAPILRNGLAPYQQQTIAAFFNAILAPEGAARLNRLSPLAWVAAVIVLPALLVALAARKDKLRVKRVCAAACMLIVGWAVWLLALLVGYLTAFTEQEAVILAAFTRYFSAYQTAVLMLAVYALIQTALSYGKRFSVLLLGLLLGAVLLLAPIADVYHATAASRHYNEKNREWLAAYDVPNRLYETMGEDDSICFLDQNPEETGYSMALMQYEALPIKVDKLIDWRFGPYDNGVVRAQTPTVEEWAQALADSAFTYLYLRNSSDWFAETYGALFENPADIADDGWYEIVRDGGVLLRRVG